MRIRSFTFLTVLALVLAACGGASTEDTTTPSTPEETTTGPAFESVRLSYDLEPGSSYEYEVEMNQTIDLSSTGDASALGEHDDLPGQMSIAVTGTTIFSYSVADGPEEGTYEINITGDFSALEFSGTVDGEPVDSSDIPEMAEMEPVDATIVVDEQGNVIPEDNSDLGADFLGGFGGLDMLQHFGAGAGTGQFIGPPFSDEDVTVGDTWTETVEIPTLPQQDPVETTLESEVTGTDTIDGNDVVVVETTTTTSAFEFDLAELLIGFMSAFVPEDATDEERAKLQEMSDQLRFVFSIDDTIYDMTTWFDPEAGITRKSQVTGDTHIVMDINIPDETTGELVQFAVDMTVGQDTTYTLTGSSDA